MINAICLKCTNQCNATNSLWLHFCGMGWKEVAGPSQQRGSVTMSATSVLLYKDNSFRNCLKKRTVSLKLDFDLKYMKIKKH